MLFMSALITLLYPSLFPHRNAGNKLLSNTEASIIETIEFRKVKGSLFDVLLKNANKEAF